MGNFRFGAMLLAALSLSIGVSVASTGQAAAQTAATGISNAVTTPCTIPLTGSDKNCSSTSPVVDRWFNATSATAESCDYLFDIYWGDGDQNNHIEVKNPAIGEHLLAAHTYNPDVQATYTISVYNTVSSGNCAPVPTTVFHFTLLAYVALGDSYSAGVGAGDYDVSAGACLRSHSAYPWLVNAVLRDTPGAQGTAFAFKACSGATIIATWPQSPQLNYLARMPAHSVGLVTFTIGGNDLGFAQFMLYCATRLSIERTCEQESESAVGKALAKLPPELARLDATIRSEQSLAPGAEVVVVGYPQFFPGGQASGCPTGVPHITFLGSDMKYIDHGIQQFDSELSKAATNAGFIYVSTTPAFQGHQLCQSQPWLTDAVPTGIESFHPTADGQSAIASAVIGAAGLAVLP
jgi:lysophospholipase L1-like esterase